MKPGNLQVRSSRKLMNEINVVPYIDVMLVLLVIFMTTAPMMTQGLKVELPDASSSAVQPKDEPVTVTVKASGSYYLDIGAEPEKSTSLEAITQRIGLIKKQKPNTLFLIEGDTNVDYGRVVKLMAALQAAGVDKLALITEPQGH